MVATRGRERKKGERKGKKKKERGRERKKGGRKGERKGERKGGNIGEPGAAASAQARNKRQRTNLSSMMGTGRLRSLAYSRLGSTARERYNNREHANGQFGFVRLSARVEGAHGGASYVW